MTWRRLIPPIWMSSVLWCLFLIGMIVGVIACGDDDDSPTIDNPTWTITHDPYGREWACLTVAPSVGVGLFCVPAPESP